MLNLIWMILLLICILLIFRQNMLLRKQNKELSELLLRTLEADNVLRSIISQAKIINTSGRTEDGNRESNTTGRNTGSN